MVIRNVNRDLQNGKLSWFDTVRNMPDDQLLPWVGVDGFVFIQTIRLIIGLIIMCGVPALFVLLPAYGYGGREDNGQLFTRFSIFHVASPKVYMVTLLYNYFVLAVVFYGIYVFYRNLEIYRQVYLSKPSATLSQVTIRRISRLVGNVDRLRSIFQLTTRTVVITNVSAKYSKKDLTEMFQKMGIYDVQTIVIVQNQRKIKSRLAKRRDSENKLNVTIINFYKTMLDHVAGVKGMKAEELEAFYRSEPRIHLNSRRSLMSRLLDGSILVAFRPTTKDENRVDVDAIIYYYRQLAERDAQLLAETVKFAEQNEFYDPNGSEDGASIKSFSSFSSETSEDIAQDGKALIGIRQFANIKDNTRDYGLTNWGTSMSVVVIFGSSRSSLMAQQCLLSARLFSMEVERAPTSDDLLWDNVYLPAVERSVRWQAGEVFYTVVNLLFTTVNLALTPLLQIERYESKYPALGQYLGEHPAIRSALKGILAPLFYNLFLFVAPYLLYGLSVYQGLTSKTRVQESLLAKMTWLLFIQSFIMFILSQAFLVVLEKIISGDWGEVIADVQKGLPDASAFFLNVIIQKALISVMLNLLKMGRLSTSILNRLLRGGSFYLFNLDVRSDRIMIGNYYPEYILFVFMILMAFLPITPIISLAGLLFYFLAYFVFRHHFIFNIELPHESGGRYWFFMPTPILVGCFMGQLFCGIQFTFDGGALYAIVLLPLMVVTFAASYFLKNTFERRSLFSPLGPEYMDKVEELENRMVAKQTETVKQIVSQTGEDVMDECEDEENSPVLPHITQPLGERAYETVPYDFMHEAKSIVESTERGEFPPLENPYCNPIVFKRSKSMCLPPCFFHLMKDALELTDTIASSTKSPSIP